MFLFCLGLRSLPIQLRQYHRFLLMTMLRRTVQYQWYIQINHFYVIGLKNTWKKFIGRSSVCFRFCISEKQITWFSFFHRRTPPIDPEILRTMKMQGTIGYAPNPQAFRRNQVRKQYSPTLLQYSPPSLLKLS